MQSLEMLGAQLKGFVHDDEVVYRQERQGLLQGLVEQEGAVAGVHIDVGVPLPRPSRKLPGRQRIEDSRPAALGSLQADGGDRRLAAAGRARANQDAVGLRRFLHEPREQGSVDAVVDGPREDGLVDVDLRLLRVQAGERGGRRGRRQRVVLPEAAVHVLLNEAPLTVQHRQSIVDVPVAVPRQLEGSLDFGVVGPPAACALQGAGVQHVMLGHASKNLDVQQVAEVAEGQVQRQPLPEVLVVEDPHGLRRDHFLPLGLAATGELRQRHPGPMSRVGFLHPANDLALIVGLLQPLEQAHVLAAPGAGLVLLHELRFVGHAGPRRLRRSHRAAQEELRQELRGEREPHLGFARLVGGEGANGHAVARRACVVEEVGKHGRAELGQVG